MVARDIGVAQDAVGVARTPDRRARTVEPIAPVIDDDDSAADDFGASGRTLRRPLRLMHGGVDHRVPFLTLAGRLALVRGWLDQPRLNPELPQPQALLGLKSDRRPSQEVITAASGVLQQVAGELLLERTLVSLQPGAVLAGEVDRVLVGDVDPGDAGGLIGVHLLR